MRLGYSCSSAGMWRRHLKTVQAASNWLVGSLGVEVRLTQAESTASVQQLQILVACGQQPGSLCTELACMYGLR